MPDCRLEIAGKGENNSVQYDADNAAYQCAIYPDELQITPDSQFQFADERFVIPLNDGADDMLADRCAHFFRQVAGYPDKMVVDGIA